MLYSDLTKNLNRVEKIHIVYACGTAGINLEKATEIGKNALNRVLTEEPAICLTQLKVGSF